MNAGRAKLLVHLLVSAVIAFSLLSTGQAQKPVAAYNPTIPRTWDEEALAELEVPLADPSHSPRDISADDYYRIPVRPIYKSYPLSMIRTRRHSLIWGAGYRFNHDSTYGSSVIHFNPPTRNYPVVSAFAQDEFALRPSRVFVTAGLKVEHNAFSGADWQPNIRARWLLPHQQVLWAALARAIRRPTRFDDDIVVTAPTGLVLVQGSDAFESEAMTGWEVGYRARAATSLSLDATAFIQRYGNLRSQEAPPSGVVPLTIGNTLDGRSSGLEIAVNVLPIDRWRMRVSYAYLDTEIGRHARSRDVSGGLNEANDPHHLFSLRTGLDLLRNVEIDAWIRRVSSLPNPPVPAYTELNARVGWRPQPDIELALVGQDLLHDQHPEFGTPLPRRIEFERSVRAFVSIRMK